MIWLSNHSALGAVKGETIRFFENNFNSVFDQEVEPILAGLFRPVDLAKTRLSVFKFEH